MKNISHHVTRLTWIQFDIDVAISSYPGSRIRTSCSMVCAQWPYAVHHVVYMCNNTLEHNQRTLDTDLYSAAAVWAIDSHMFWRYLSTAISGSSNNTLIILMFKSYKQKTNNVQRVHSGTSVSEMKHKPHGQSTRTEKVWGTKWIGCELVLSFRSSQMVIATSAAGWDFI